MYGLCGLLNQKHLQLLLLSPACVVGGGAPPTHFKPRAMHARWVGEEWSCGTHSPTLNPEPFSPARVPHGGAAHTRHKP